MDIIEKADQIAEKAHDGQVRKTDNIPYISHPRAVAEILREYGFSDIVVAAALVHDVIEDTDVSEEELRKELGDEIVNIVASVSEDKSLPWEERKELYVKAVANSPEEVKAVSLADKIHNASSLIASHNELGTDVWSKFNRGKEKKIWFEQLVLDSISSSWDHPLVSRYRECVEELSALSS